MVTRLMCFVSILILIASACLGQGNHVQKLDPSHMLPIADAGKALAQIVIPADGDCGVVRFAAREMQDILERSTGVRLRIAAQADDARTSIVLGDCELARSAGVVVQGLPRDAFIIRTVGNKVFIAGRDSRTADPVQALPGGKWANIFERATLFGVYDFLERFTGTRFYFPGELGVIVPKREKLSVPAMDIYEAPDLPQRALGILTYPLVTLEGTRDELFTEQNHYQYMLRLETEYVPCNHGLSRLGLMHRFGQSNPEFFALLTNGKRDNDPKLTGRKHLGHLCFTDAGLRDAIVRDATAFLSGKPPSATGATNPRYSDRPMWDPSGFQPGYFNISLTDGFGPKLFCQCPDCQAYYSKGQASELIWEFTADIAKRLKQAGVPGYVTQAAYSVARPIPKVDIPDNVLVQVCVVGPWLERNPRQQHEMDALVKGWVDKLGRKVWLWNYMNKFGSKRIPGAPCNTPRAVASYFKRMGKYITGSYLSSDSEYAFYQYLNYQVWSKIAWRLDTDVEALLDEHFRLMFGQAAQTMAKYYDELEEIWLLKILGDTKSTPLGPKNVIPSRADIWERIYDPLYMARSEAIFEQAREQARGDADSLARIEFIYDRMFGETKRVRRRYVEETKERDALVQDVPRAEKGSITVDGRLDDPGWRRAKPMQMRALGNKKPLVDTAVRTLWDSETLYLSFNCDEPNIAGLVMEAETDDDTGTWRDSSVEVLINQSEDRKRYIHLMISATGAVADAMVDARYGKASSDYGWDSNAKAQAQVGSERWTLEMAIPLQSFLTEEIRPGETTIVLNFNRSRHVRGVPATENEYYTWSPLVVRAFSEIDNFGRLRFVE